MAKEHMKRRKFFKLKVGQKKMIELQWKNNSKFISNHSKCNWSFLNKTSMSEKVKISKTHKHNTHIQTHAEYLGE